MGYLPPERDGSDRLPGWYLPLLIIVTATLAPLLLLFVLTWFLPS